MADDEIAVLPPTIAELPFFASGRFPRPDLLGRCTANGIVYLSAKEFIEQVRDLSLGLATLGMARGSRVALLAESRPEWLMSDFAVLSAGAVTVPVYTTLSAEQVAFILRDAGVTLAIVSTVEQLRKVESIASTVPSLEAIVVLDPPDPGAAAGPVPVMTYREALEAGHRAMVESWGVAKAFRDGARDVAPGDVATVIYTSGTTGQPKGVELTHANLIANLDGIRQVIPLVQEDVALSFLPLCHAFERIVAFYYFASGNSLVLAESFDTIARDLKLARPTVMTGVPRVFEKLHARVMASGHESTGFRRRLFDMSAALAVERGRRLPLGQSLTLWQSVLSRVAERLVYHRIRDGIGGRLRLVVSGSAALRVDIAQFFYGVGLPILEGYGLTETSPVVAVSPLEAIRFGTVGPPLPNVEVRLSDDGEILVRGPSVMKGYLGKPEETAQAIRDGWFYTGDIGELDEAGYLKITDRKKELIVTSGGKKIAPQPIEGALRSDPLIAEAVLVGTTRHFPGALIVPDAAALAARLGQAWPEDSDARQALLARDDVQGWFQEAVNAVNADLAQYQKVKRFRLLERPFTVEAGEITPTLKVKRRVIEERYAREIGDIYAGDESRH